MRKRKESYTVEYHRSDGRRDGQPEDDNLSRQRAHVLAKRWILMYPNKAAIIYFEIDKPNGLAIGKRGLESRGAKLVKTVARFLGSGWTRRLPKSVMETEGKYEEIDVPVIRADRLERASSKIPTFG